MPRPQGIWSRVRTPSGSSDIVPETAEALSRSANLRGLQTLHPRGPAPGSRPGGAVCTDRRGCASRGRPVTGKLGTTLTSVNRGPLTELQRGHTMGTTWQRCPPLFVDMRRGPRSSAPPWGKQAWEGRSRKRSASAACVSRQGGGGGRSLKDYFRGGGLQSF